jgi:hypothetical protein
MSLESSEEAAENPSRGHATNKDNFELHVDGFKGTPEEIERQW